MFDLIQFRDLNGAESSRLNLTMRTTWALPPGRQLTHWTGASLAPTFSITSKLTAPALERLARPPWPKASALAKAQMGKAPHFTCWRRRSKFFVDPANVP